MPTFFTDYLSPYLKFLQSDNEEELRQAFAVWDLEDRGWVSGLHLRHVMTVVEEKPSPVEVDAMLLGVGCCGNTGSHDNTGCYVNNGSRGNNSEERLGFEQFAELIDLKKKKIKKRKKKASSGGLQIVEENNRNYAGGIRGGVLGGIVGGRHLVDVSKEILEEEPGVWCADV